MTPPLRWNAFRKWILPMPPISDWNDLRLVLAVLRSGSLTGAAEVLKMNHSTVYRRLSALERSLGVRIFERDGGRYRATEAGTRVAEAAERVEVETLMLDRDLVGKDACVSGRLRVTSSETLAYWLLTSLLAELR